MILFLLLFAVLRSAALTHGNAGGTASKKTNALRVPFHVTVTTKVHSDLYICGGAIISNVHILTAGSCTRSYVNDRIETQLLVRVGSPLWNVYGVVHKVKNVVRHPSYQELDAGSPRFDLCIITLEKPIKFNGNAKAIKISDKNVTRNDYAIITGFGPASFAEMNTGAPTRLRGFKVPFLPYNLCNKYFPANGLSTGTGCTFKSHKASFKGDIGGPVIFGTELIGIVSWVPRFDVGMPTVYTDLTHPEVRSFIDGVTRF
ncbi:UNVERIFIED_CONTAM: hypothetical protein PYX00_002373 [Menopon gallinae]|uniref:Peptidase S1 domain-containing protein n=1 Tax=Menopon gallinae TaxID=328185 RepID=A0AAW2IG83_9NEOP